MQQVSCVSVWSRCGRRWYLSGMFTWLKKLVSNSAAPAQAPKGPIILPKEDPRDTIQLATVWEVVDRFLKNNPSPTVYGVHALVEAGAANLLEPAELFQACEKIQEHGYQYPLNPTLINELEQGEFLEFLSWHGQNQIELEFYANESTIRELIERFRMGR